MKNWKTLIAILLLAAAHPAQAGLFEEMVQLERAYVPALGITNQTGKDALALESTRRLSTAWKRFVQNTAPEAKQDVTLVAALTEVDAGIGKALGLLEGGGSLKEAHDALETVRVVLWKWRAGKGIAYFPDLLTAFHDVMEHLADLMLMPSPDQIKLKQALEATVGRWTRVENAVFDGSVYGFDSPKVERMKGLLAKEREILGQVGALVAGADRERLSGAAKSMKGNFAQLYFLFGDFKGLQSQ